MAEASAHRFSGTREAAGGGMLLFRVDGVPVQLAPSWWVGSLVIVLLYAPLVDTFLPWASPATAWLLAVAFAVLLGLSVLAHELGHCVVALRMRLPVRRLRLYLLGGLTEIARAPRRPKQEGAVAAAGPVVSLGLAALFGLLLLPVPGNTAMWLLVAQCAVANVVVGLFNLLPGLPLDGGRMLRAGVWALSGHRGWGTRVAVVGGGVVAFALLVWALLGFTTSSEDRWLRLGVCVLTAWFVAVGATAELAAEERRSWPAGLRVADLVRPVLQLPAESPIADTLAAAGGHGVVLVRADGVAVGLLDEAAGQRLARESPASPAELAAEPILPETVLLDSETGEEISERVRDAPAWQFLVVDTEGRPSGVLRRQELRAALAGRARG